MATYSERIEYKEEILPDQVIQLRTATVVLKDGKEVGRSYHREVFCPGDDVSSAPQEVQDIVNALWSPQVVSAYQASIEVPSEDITTADIG